MPLQKCVSTAAAMFLVMVGFWLYPLVTHATDARPGQTRPPRPPLKNVLLILADDLGVDILSVYREGSDFPVTPTIDRLASEGVMFRNTWATPNCSPTRATILTGRYGFRTGVAGLVTSVDLAALSADEIIIPEVLDRFTGTHQNAMFGKWHLGNCLNGRQLGPNLAGFSHYAGSFSNIVNKGKSFFNWKKTINGKRSTVQKYATTDTVDDAIAWINAQTAPWFLYLPFNAPHQPFQIPPYHLVSPTTLATLPKDAQGQLRPPGTFCEGDAQRDCYFAMVEAMDREIGRLLAALPPAVRAQTTVIFVGDNGTPGDVARAPFRQFRVKSTLYEGGINVPLIVQGAGVVNPNRESAALVNTTDLFATALELATGRPVSQYLPADLVHDSVSIVPILNDTATTPSLRNYVYSELHHPTRTRVQRQFGHTIRNGRFKFIRFTTKAEDEFYDLHLDPFEENNLLDNPLNDIQTLHLNALRQEMARLRAPTENACPIEVLCSDCTKCVVRATNSRACDLENTGARFCQRPDASLFNCPLGQTVHTVRCPCTGTLEECASRQDQQLVCQ